MDNARTSPGYTVGSLIAARIRSAPAFTYTNEDALQAALAEYLRDAGWATTREHTLSDGRNRIDLLVVSGLTFIGIEVKTAGTAQAVIQQLTRYAQVGDHSGPDLDELILVTTRASHRRVPRELGARRTRVHVASLIGQGL